MPRAVLLTTCLLCGVAAILGLRAGWRYATLTESEMIAAAVADYVDHEEQNGVAVNQTDCAARPGEGKVWVVVLCMPPSNSEARRTEYFISRWGHMERFRGG